MKMSTPHPQAGDSLYCKHVAHKGDLIDPNEVPGYNWERSPNFDPKKYKKNNVKYLGDFKLQGKRGRFHVWQVQLDPIWTVDSLGRVYLAQLNKEAGAEA